MSGVTDKPLEKVPALGLEVTPNDAPVGGAATVYVEPTQMRRPWQATVRTAFQALLALATLLPFIAAGVYSSSDAYPAVVAQVLAAAATFSRIMAMPTVERFLQDYFPWLAAAPPKKGEHEAGATVVGLCLLVAGAVAIIVAFAWLAASNPGGR